MLIQKMFACTLPYGARIVHKNELYSVNYVTNHGGAGTTELELIPETGPRAHRKTVHQAAFSLMEVHTALV